MIALRQVLTHLRVGVAEQPLEQLAGRAVRARHHGRAYRRIRVLGERHPEGMREAAVERECVREPIVGGDHVVGQVRALGDAAMSVAVGEEAADEFRR
ncbi:hypothetical protein ACFRR7_28580 [Streptomyces sp. NPDC056909]|uniref:hypothetical protein n=1 Tax=Streptomyces sp. NPDC056909 TaxID=3345963 RepID=UPI0036A1B739